MGVGDGARGDDDSLVPRRPIPDQGLEEIEFDILVGVKGLGQFDGRGRDDRITGTHREKGEVFSFTSE